MFRRHVQDTCQHEARVPVVVCRICHLKLSRFQKATTKDSASISTKIQIEDTSTKQDSLEKNFTKLGDEKSIPEALTDYRSIMSHLYQSHVTLVYRCTACPRAFVKKESIYEHRIQEHDINSTNVGGNNKGNFTM